MAGELEKQERREEEAKRKNPLASFAKEMQADMAEATVQRLQSDPAMRAKIAKGLEHQMLQQMGVEQPIPDGNWGNIVSALREVMPIVPQLIQKAAPDSAKDATIAQLSQQIANANAAFARIQQVTGRPIQDLLNDAPKQIATDGAVVGGDSPVVAVESGHISEAVPAAESVPQEQPTPALETVQDRSQFLLTLMASWVKLAPAEAAERAKALLASGQLPESKAYIDMDYAALTAMLKQASEDPRAPGARLIRHPMIASVDALVEFFASEGGDAWWRDFQSLVLAGLPTPPSPVATVEVVREGAMAQEFGQPASFAGETPS